MLIAVTSHAVIVAQRLTWVRSLMHVVRFTHTRRSSRKSQYLCVYLGSYIAEVRTQWWRLVCMCNSSLRCSRTFEFSQDHPGGFFIWHSHPERWLPAIYSIGYYKSDCSQKYLKLFVNVHVVSTQFFGLLLQSFLVLSILFKFIRKNWETCSYFDTINLSFKI